MRYNYPTNFPFSKVAGIASLLLSISCHSSGSGSSAVASHAVAMTQVTSTPGTAIALTAQRTTATLRDGSTLPMWGYCQTGTAGCTGSWAPGPTIYAAAGTALNVALTNSLPVPTSLVILGQVGGGLGTPSTMASPVHAGQNYTTFPGNVAINPPGTGNAFVPPAQGPRVRSFGTEVAAGAAATLTWPSLKPGTYLYETGTLPSLQVGMGLYGVLVVSATGTGTCSVTTTTSCTSDAACPTGETCVGQQFTAGSAYANVSYDADATVLFSEIDPVMNRLVDGAAVAGADVNKRWNDPSCSTTAPCYPAAVNYAPTYFLINGNYFDATSPQNTEVDLSTAAYATGNVLLRLVNAGSRTHVPAFVGLTLGVVAEDGNPAPGNTKLQSEVLLTAGKTFDTVVSLAAASPATTPATFAPATYPLFDRSLSLSTGNYTDGGMQGFLLVNHSAAATTTVTSGTVTTTVPTPGAPGNLPVAVAPAAVADSFKVPYNTPITGNVTLNDVGVSKVALGTNVSNGTLTLSADGSFTYTPAAGFSGTDSFTYVGNGIPTVTATVTLTVANLLTGAGNTPVANNDTFNSAVSSQFSAPRPGVLANDTDPNGFPLTATGAVNGTCGSVTLNTDGSFSVTGAGVSCQFTYTATNSQGTASAAATVTVNFGAASGLAVSVVDGVTGTPVSDYRWIIQEDLTFKTGKLTTPTVSTRTIGTSFHRSHMNVVAAGCVGPNSCGTGQTVRGVAQAPANDVPPSSVTLDPTKNYYISILPGDGAPPAHAMGGSEIKQVNGAWAPLSIAVQQAPLIPAQMSIYIYEDNQPTNGQNEPTENGLGGFNIILFDPAGRTGDVAGQQSYDAFNMPLSNSLLGSPGCPDELNVATNGAGSSSSGNQVGVVYTCPNPPPGYTGDPAVYALAGRALIKNLTPARYDVVAHPGQAREAAGEIWWQTETLEGTPAQDAFVGVNEPEYFQEFGPPGPHTTIGFVNPVNVAVYAASTGQVGTHTITGKITNQHMSHPSDVTLWDSTSYGMLSSTTCLVALNSLGGSGPAIATAECDPDGNFVVSNVPAGDYELDIFDQWLDQIIQASAVTVPAATPTVALGNIPVLSWFTLYDQNIFMDLNGNGKYDAGEPGIANVPLTVRYRNGAPSNVTLTDSSGNGLLPELFPLFNWYVAEADTTRFKQTGVHIIVDGGGKTDTAGAGANLWTSTYADGTSSDRVEQPGALSYGVQSFISQRNHVEWGRTPYAKGENGGITGYVVYSSTRPFDDMRYNVQTIWEPLVPRITVNLYKKQTLADGTETLALVDSTKTSSWDDFVNLVYGADSNQYLIGSDNQLRDPTTGALAPAAAYPPGKQVNMQCPGQLPGTSSPPPWDLTAVDPFTNYTLGGDRQRCYDGWHNWNQMQAAPYDGRYVFPSAAYVAAHPLCSATVTTNCTTPAPGQTLVSLPPGTYVVEAVTPAGYSVVKEEDKNILIGDAFVAQTTQQFGGLSYIFILPDQATLNNSNPYNPSTGDAGFQTDPTSNLGVTASMLVFPECVGALHRVPDYLSLFPAAQQVSPFAGMDRPLCDRKRIVLNDQQQQSATFFVFTEVPMASNNTGIILDDATSEFNAIAPDFGEKATVPFVPVSIKDFTGHEVSRTYSDQWGAYNMMTYSSWLVNPPTPSGYGPNMLVTCMNDPGPIPDPANPGKMITDPAYNPAYSNFCYTNPFMPGQTTYLDTPVLPIAAFATGYNPPDCAPADQAPAIARVDSSAGFGPWLPASGGTLTITAQGDQIVQNPAYAGPFATTGLASQRTVTRHYGFGGTKGKVKVGNVDLTAFVTSWTDTTISLIVPGGTPTGELVVTANTANGPQSTVDAVTVNMGGGAPTRVSAAAGQTIQNAVDAANPGDLIMIDAGLYNELVIMWKPVRLQGVGAASVVINAAKYPTSKLSVWRPRINEFFAIDSTTGNQIGTAQVDPLPTQEITGGVVLLEPSVLGSEEGAGITVLAKNLPAGNCLGGPSPTYSTIGIDIAESNFRCARSRIDGISVTGGDAGGGIYVNGWAHGLEISNNRVYGNAGAYNGGVRVGVPYLELEALPTGTTGGRIAGFGYDVNVTIHHNSISKNGTVEAPAGAGGAGGGVSICTGTDNYSLDHNFICGNYSASDGGGVGHLGFSQGGSIAFNQILFNQSFQQTNSTHGGGITVAGEPPVAGAVSLGTGDLTIDANLIRGNFAEGGQGGGIRLQQVNGADVTGNPPGRWHRVRITNNMIVGNIAGWAGGGISMADTLNASINDNTISSNDSTGIAGVVLAGGVPLPAAAGGVPGMGQPGPAGIVSEPTSAALLGQITNPGQKIANAISQPQLNDNILWQNRSFYYSGTGQICPGNNIATVSASCTPLPDQATSGQCVSGAAYWDIGVLNDASRAPGAVHLNPTFSVMTSRAGYTGNGLTTNDPALVSQYCNGSRVVPELPGVLNPPSIYNLQVAATVDEGNNYVNLRYGPLYTVIPGTATSFGDFHLTGTSSSAYNTGTATGASNHDFDSQPRPLAGAYDIGADEYAVPSPIMVASPIALTFGRVTVGSTNSLSVTVSNDPTATANLVLANPTISGGNSAAAYTFTTGCSTGGTGLTPGSACTISVTFKPTSNQPSPQTATLTVNATNAPAATVSLTGTGVGPATASPASLTFPATRRSTTSATQLVTLSNPAGNPAITSVSLSFGGANGNDFRRSGGSCGNTVFAGTSCTIGVVFAPRTSDTVGTKSGTLSINTGGVPSPGVVSLSGTAQ